MIFFVMVCVIGAGAGVDSACLHCAAGTRGCRILFEFVFLCAAITRASKPRFEMENKCAAMERR